jgi:hypothetical protein
MEIISTFPRLRGATLEGISANLHGGSIKKLQGSSAHRQRHRQRVLTSIWLRRSRISGRAWWMNVQPFSFLEHSL